MKPRRHTANPPTGKVGFVSATQIAAGGAISSVVAGGDFNGDGIEDLVTTVATDNNGSSGYALSVVLGNGDGTFQSPVLTTIADPCPGFVVGDVNGDKKDDILLIHVGTQCGNAASSFDVFLSKGDGTFSQGNNYAVSQAPVLGGGLYITTDSGHLALMAVDGGTGAASNVFTVLGNGDGTFSTTPTSVTLSGQVWGKAVLADLNGDGLLDIVGNIYAGDPTFEVIVFLATSKSAYATGVVYNNPGEVWGACNLAVSDLNGDGYPEIVAPNCLDENITVFVNNKDGSFQPAVYYNAAVGGSGSAAAAGVVAPEAVAIADVNGDGKPDLISTNTNSADVTILTGKGDGTFNVPTVGYAVGGGPSGSAVVGDFNGDGLPDLVVADGQLSLVFLKGYGDGTFRASLNYYVPVGNQNYGQAQDIASGDFNGDGIPDFVLGGYDGVTVFLSRPDGSLQPGVTYGLSANEIYVAVADFNQDGKLDFAATDNVSNVQIFTGNGDGTFATGATFATGGSIPYDLVAADFNGDGYPDLAVTNLNFDRSVTGSIGVLLNDKTGNFLSAVAYPLSYYFYSGAIAAGDVNGDGKIDLVVPYWNDTSLAIFLGNGDGTFQAESNASLGDYYPGTVTLADVNGDGITDLVVTVSNMATVGTDIAVLLGSNNGGVWGYQPPTYYTTSLHDYETPVMVVDVDGDGIPDLVYGTVGILFGVGNGLFDSPVDYPVGGGPIRLAIADLNGDGAPDVAVAGQFQGVTVLLNANGSAARTPDYTVVVNSPFATVTAGSSASFAFTITPSDSYNGTIAFGCRPLPSLISCSFNPVSVTLDGSTPVTVTLALSTAAPATPSNSSMRPAAITPPRGPVMLLAGISGMGVFGLMFVGGLRKRNRWFGAALGLIFMAVLFWVACGSNGNRTTSPPPTKAATTTMLGSSRTTVLVGTSVTLTGKVAASSGMPTGNVNFLDGAKPLGTGTLSSGTATFQTSSLVAGVHSITASYSGDSNFEASTSAALSQSVQNAGTSAGTYTITVTANGTAGTNRGNTSAHLVQLTLTVN